MKKKVIGYIFSEENIGKDEKTFLKLAAKKGIELIMFNLCKDMNEKEIEINAKKCDIIFNNSAEEFAFELVKTLEELGKKVIDSSRIYYFTEDKWIFFLECKKHNIPTLQTILLSENINIAKKELHEFVQWPVVLKRIEGTCGQYVDKADNLQQAEKIIKRFWKKGSEKLPIIAQEFIDSPCYRVTVIGDKIVQAVVKNSSGWKKTGVYAKNIKKFKVDDKLKKIVKKINKFMKINICGIDILKKNNKWLVLEVNSTPAFDFFESERKKIISQVLDFLIKKI